MSPTTARTVFTIGDPNRKAGGKFKSIQRLQSAASHNARMPLGDKEINIKNANPSYDIYNQDLTPMFSGNPSIPFDFIADKSKYKGFDYSHLYKDRLNTLSYYDNHKIRKNANIALEFVVSFSHDKVDDIDLGNWKKANIEWFDKTFNVAPDKKNNVISAILHLDEGTPHIHFIIVPIDERGHLNSQRWLDGPTAIKELRESYDLVMKPFGLEGGITHSRARKDSLPAFYKVIDNAMLDIPEHEIGEPVEDYMNRALEYIQIRSGKERLQIKKEMDEAIRNLSIEKEAQMQEIQSEYERIMHSIPKDIKRLEERKNSLSSEISSLNEEAQNLRLYINNNQELLNAGIRLKEFEKVRNHYKNDPTINASFECVISAFNNWNDDSHRQYEEFDISLASNY